jgi:hypothetical protein
MDLSFWAPDAHNEDDLDESALRVVFGRESTVAVLFSKSRKTAILLELASSRAATKS